MKEQTKNGISIYVITHKAFQQSIPSGYHVLQVGAAFGEDLGYLKDNTGDNISEKNKNYCELTGLYWIWKNTDEDIVGLCHYRRYLSNRPLDRKLKHILSVDDIDNRLAKNDIILPYPVYTRKTVGEYFCENHSSKDFNTARSIIAKSFPDYLEDFDAVMNGHTCYQCNMFISSKEKADAYCEWLFAVLYEMEKETDLTGYSPYQARLFGFMSERLLGVWVHHQHYKVSHAFFASTEVNYLKSIGTKMKEIMKA